MAKYKGRQEESIMADKIVKKLVICIRGGILAVTGVLAISIKGILKYNNIAYAKETQEPEFLYQEIESGTIKLVRYIGKNSEVTVPEIKGGRLIKLPRFLYH